MSLPGVRRSAADPARKVRQPANEVASPVLEAYKRVSPARFIRVLPQTTLAPTARVRVKAESVRLSSVRAHPRASPCLTHSLLQSMRMPVRRGLLVAAGIGPLCAALSGAGCVRLHGPYPITWPSLVSQRASCEKVAGRFRDMGEGRLASAPHLAFPLRLIRFGGHLSKGGYDVPTDGRHPATRRPPREELSR
jgi:hypothetical protein